MPFARHATDHQRPHAHEARPQSAEKLSKHPDTGTGTLKKILVEKEAGLDRSHRSAVVLDDKVTIVEALLDRVLDDLIVAMVFALRPKGLFPTRTTCQLGPRDELDCKGLGFFDGTPPPYHLRHVVISRLSPGSETAIFLMFLAAG